jgi:hypothetical protein
MGEIGVFLTCFHAVSGPSRILFAVRNEYACNGLLSWEPGGTVSAGPAGVECRLFQGCMVKSYYAKGDC